MPIVQRIDDESKSLFVEASGFLSWDERHEGIESFRKAFETGRIKYALFDLRNLSGENDAKAEVEFGKLMVEALSAFSEIRAAVVLSADFLVSSSVVLRLQKSGFKILDFRTLEEAMAWLYND